MFSVFSIAPRVPILAALSLDETNHLSPMKRAAIQQELSMVIITASPACSRIIQPLKF
jgi:hypothetical protein